jgi:hypothetical protein
MQILSDAHRHLTGASQIRLDLMQRSNESLLYAGFRG